MNASLIADLEHVLDTLQSAYEKSDSVATNYEMAIAKTHVERAIRWEKTRP